MASRLGFDSLADSLEAVWRLGSFSFDSRLASIRSLEAWQLQLRFEVGFDSQLEATVSFCGEVVAKW